MRDDTKKDRIFSRRALILGSLKVGFFASLYARYYYLQIIDSHKYQTLSDKNRIKFLITSANRGVIKDRNNVDLVTNKLIYKLYYEGKDLDDIRLSVAKLNQILVDPITLDEKAIQKQFNQLKSSYTILSHDLTWENVAKIELWNNDLDYISVNHGFKRFYNYGSDIAHITGYTGSPNETELSQLEISNHNDFILGKNGIEKFFDHDLQGKPGIKRTEVNANGNFVRNLTEQPSYNGNDIKLSIDLRVQQFVADLFATHLGSLVLVEINTGEIISLYSSPSYDPNLFVGGISKHNWQNIILNPNTPLINKAISYPYPPGSTFKMISALAGLEHGVNPNTKIICRGEHKVGSHVFHCWNKYGHGAMDLKLAIAQSCNIYFYTISEQIGIRALAKVARTLGLGSKCGITLPYESAGNIPDPGWKLSKYKQKWTLGDTINTSIGQGFVLATPLQLVYAITKIVAKKAVTPTLLHQNKNISYDLLPFSNHNLDLVSEGMYMAVNDIRGNSYKHRFHYPDFNFCGKTGTAQVISQRKITKKHLDDHGLFVGFAPYNNPKYAIATIIEHGSWGAISALPVAKKVFERLYTLDMC